MLRTMGCALVMGVLGWAQGVDEDGYPLDAAYTKEEFNVVRELNRIRQYPKHYGAFLRDLRDKYYRDGLWRLPKRIPIRMQEGPEVFDEAIQFLETVEPCPPLVINETLAKAALEHVKNQGPSGETGHRGLDGSKSSDRIERYGTYTTVAGEIINYGPEVPRYSVLQLVLDDGVPNRGHRKAVFNREFRVAGPAIGPHKTYGSMTVVVLVDDYLPKGASRSVLASLAANSQPEPDPKKKGGAKRTP